MKLPKESQHIFLHKIPRKLPERHCKSISVIHNDNSGTSFSVPDPISQPSKQPAIDLSIPYVRSFDILDLSFP